MSGTVLVLGGRSEIGLAVARKLVDGGRKFVLAARRSGDLDSPAAAVRRAGASEVGGGALGAGGLGPP
ncbi:oxidoreductase, partial [Amycolatopsis thermoflava]